MLISNDTSLMHLGSYLNIPVIALFGPSNWRCFGPLSKGSKVLNNDQDVKLINVPDVIEAVSKSI